MSDYFAREFLSEAWQRGINLILKRKLRYHSWIIPAATMNVREAASRESCKPAKCSTRHRKTFSKSSTTDFFVFLSSTLSPIQLFFFFLFLLRCKQQKAFTTYTTGNFGTDRAKHKSEVVIGGKEKCLCNECLSLYLRYRCLLEWLSRVKFLQPLACRVKFSFFIRKAVRIWKLQTLNAINHVYHSLQPSQLMLSDLELNVHWRIRYVYLYCLIGC